MMLYFRKDIGKGEWLISNVGMLRDLLTKAEIPDHWEIMPNGIGNLALCEPEWRGDHWTRWYIGYIDMATGEMFVNPGACEKDDRPGYPDQCPWGPEDVGPIYVERSDFETNQP
jgi:hypothetical protein